MTRFYSKAELDAAFPAYRLGPTYGGLDPAEDPAVKNVFVNGVCVGLLVAGQQPTMLASILGQDRVLSVLEAEEGEG